MCVDCAGFTDQKIGETQVQVWKHKGTIAWKCMDMLVLYEIGIVCIDLTYFLYFACIYFMIISLY